MNARAFHRLAGHRITERWPHPRTVWLCDCGSVWESQ